MVVVGCGLYACTFVELDIRSGILSCFIVCTLHFGAVHEHFLACSMLDSGSYFACLFLICNIRSGESFKILVTRLSLLLRASPTCQGLPTLSW